MVVIEKMKLPVNTTRIMKLLSDAHNTTFSQFRSVIYLKMIEKKLSLNFILQKYFNAQIILSQIRIGNGKIIWKVPVINNRLKKSTKSRFYTYRTKKQKINRIKLRLDR